MYRGSVIFQVLHFPALRFGPSFSGPAFFSLCSFFGPPFLGTANSAPPYREGQVAGQQAKQTSSFVTLASGATRSDDGIIVFVYLIRFTRSAVKSDVITTHRFVLYSVDHFLV